MSFVITKVRKMKRMLYILLILFLENPFKLNAEEQELSHEYFEKIINHVNQAENTWKAGHNFHGLDKDKLNNLLGSLEEPPEDDEETKYITNLNHKPGSSQTNIEFDARLKWPQCPSIGHIPNQGNCAADWVIAPLAAIADRICIATNASTKIGLSVHQAVSCCKTCGFGCEKGYPKMVYKKYITDGFVTGGGYNSKQGCQPYEMKPCSNYKKCAQHENLKTPQCKPYCYNSAYKKSYKDDKYKGYQAFHICCLCCAPYQISTYGPITGSMMVYEDFLTYKKGIYQHVTGKRLGLLTVKIIGYNFKNKNESYWIGVNSWGKDWGDNGTFKIKLNAPNSILEGRLYGAWVEKPNDDDDDD